MNFGLFTLLLGPNFKYHSDTLNYCKISHNKMMSYLLFILHTRTQTPDRLHAYVRIWSVIRTVSVRGRGI